MKIQVLLECFIRKNNPDTKIHNISLMLQTGSACTGVCSQNKFGFFPWMHSINSSTFSFLNVLESFSLNTVSCRH